jgi:Ca2+-binding EF-hand superfamily protein
MKIRYLIGTILFAAACSVSAEDMASDKQFMTLDANNDGFLTQTELSSVKKLADRWTALDVNKDGRIEKAEFALLDKAEAFVPVEEEDEPIGAAPTD